MAELLRLEALTLRNREGRTVFRDLELRLEAGERVHVQAAPGTGGTALLRLAAGLTQPQEGRVLLEGVALGPYTVDHPFLTGGGLGWVPTEGGLLANLSLSANVALPLRFLRGHSRVQAEEMALEGLERAGLGALAGLRPHALEPRERWMGALVRAALTRPRLWLLDKPPGRLEGPEWRRAEDMVRQTEGAFLAVDEAWKPLANAEYHLEQGRLLPGGL